MFLLLAKRHELLIKSFTIWKAKFSKDGMFYMRGHLVSSV